MIHVLETFNHKFIDCFIPIYINNKFEKRIGGNIDFCKYCNKCNIIFIFVIFDKDDGNINSDNCYFFLNEKEIFERINNLNELNLTCEEIQIKLLLE